LWNIAQSQLGKGSRWKEIYNLNKEVIEKEAKRRGKSSSDKGYWIFPGTVLSLP
jgi:nucleoid-associated protein YgaU